MAVKSITDQTDFNIKACANKPFVKNQK